jgi:hypothetical protein
MALCFSPAVARATDLCAAQEPALTSSMDVYVRDAPSDSAFARSASAYNEAVKQAKEYCKPTDHLVPYYTALLDAWKGWLDHWDNPHAAQVPVEKGIQLLTLCSSRYFGSDEGANCEQWQRKFIHWQSGWDREPAL